MKLFLLPMAALFAVSPAWGDVEVRFDEGAPKDQFTVRNSGDCALEGTRITIDLTESAAGLIFDVTETGAGVEVFQPLELVAGEEFLSSIPEVVDGDKSLVFELDNFGAGEEFAFTIDVDDTAGQREITVSGWEITGARVAAQHGQEEFEGLFTADSQATVAMSGCTS